MMTWPHFAPSSPTSQTPNTNHLQDKDFLSNPPELLVEETLDSQEEYPQEEEEGAAEATQEEGAIQEYQQHHNREQTPLETN